MQTNRSTRRLWNRVDYAICGAVLILTVVIVGMRLTHKAAAAPVPPKILLGTNQLGKGAKLFNYAGKNLGTVLETDDHYLFDDGEMGAAVFILAPNGVRVWVPRTNLNKVRIEG